MVKPPHIRWDTPGLYGRRAGANVAGLTERDFFGADCLAVDAVRRDGFPAR